jgi:hypothetical protein
MKVADMTYDTIIAVAQLCPTALSQFSREQLQAAWNRYTDQPAAQQNHAIQFCIWFTYEYPNEPLPEAYR